MINDQWSMNNGTNDQWTMTNDQWPMAKYLTGICLPGEFCACAGTVVRGLNHAFTHFICNKTIIKICMLYCNDRQTGRNFWHKGGQFRFVYKNSFLTTDKSFCFDRVAIRSDPDTLHETEPGTKKSSKIHISISYFVKIITLIFSFIRMNKSPLKETNSKTYNYFFNWNFFRFFFHKTVPGQCFMEMLKIPYIFSPQLCSYNCYRFYKQNNFNNINMK